MIFELPLALWPGREPALGFLMEREVRLNTGWNLYLGNGQPPQGAITACVLTLAGSTDDSLAIFVNGIPLKDDNLTAGTDPTEFDLFDLATTAGITLNTGDLVELFAKDNVVGYWSMFPWVAVMEFDDDSEITAAGGDTVVNAFSDFAPHYRSMGAFTLGAKPIQQATSYQLIDSVQSFAMRGVLMVDYESSAPVIDEIGITLTLLGVDTALGEYSEFNAFANDLLLLIDGELLSVSNAELIAANTYRLSVFRARLGTFKETHDAGADVFLFSVDDFISFTHPIAQPGNRISFKLARIGGGLTGDAGEVESIGFAVTGSRIAPKISNLAVNGDLSGVARSYGDDFELSWSLPENLDLASGWTFQTRIQITQAGDLKYETTSDDNSLTMAASVIDPLVVGPFTIKARLEATKDGITIHSEYCELFVDDL